MASSTPSPPTTADVQPSQSKRRKQNDVRSLLSPGTFALIAGGAFTVGVTGALVISLRRGRARDVAEAAELASTHATGDSSTQMPAVLSHRAGAAAQLPLTSTSPSSAPQASPSPTDPLSSAVDAGPLTLFLSMNKAAFSRKGRTPETSMFDATSDAPPPSALMKSKARRTATFPPAAASAARAGGGAEHGVGAMLRARREQEGKEEETPKENQGSPVWLTIKAFSAATAIVGGTAFAMLEVGRRLLGIQGVDDFTALMGKAFPRGSDASQLAERIGGRSRPPTSDVGSASGEGEVILTDTLAERHKDNRSTFEKIEEWFHLVREEIEASGMEEEEQLERRKGAEERLV